MRLIKKEKYVLRFGFFDMISQSVNLSLFATYKQTKRPLPSKRHRGNFLNFSSGLEETLMMRLITKEKYVLRFYFLIWSLEIWIWMSVFWLCYFFGHSKFLLLCTKPPSSLQTARGNFLNFSSGLEETLMMRLKICSMIRFFDMISQSLILNLFATYKLIKRPLPSKWHREISLIFPQIKGRS